jgi:hypothetical protein
MFYGNHNHDASEQLSTQVRACISWRESSKLKWHADADARWCCDSQTVLALKAFSAKEYRVRRAWVNAWLRGFQISTRPSLIQLSAYRAPGNALKQATHLCHFVVIAPEPDPMIGVLYSTVQSHK